MSTDDTTPSAPQFNSNDDAAPHPADSHPAQAGQTAGGERHGSHSTSAANQAEAPQAPQSAQSAQSAQTPGAQHPQDGGPGQAQYGGADQAQYGGPDQPHSGAQGQAQYGAASQPQYGTQNQNPYGAQGQGTYGVPGQPQHGAPGQAQYGAPAYGSGNGQGHQTGSQGQQQGYQQTQQQGYQSGPYQFSGMQPQDARLWATLTHLAAPALYLLSAGFAGFVAPLILWLVFKEKDPLVRQAGAGSFNFNFALMLISIAAWVLGIVTLGLLLPLTGLVLTIVFIVQVVFGILGAMAANKGEAYKYPFEVGILK
ncbi:MULTISPECIES: DUF4870 domain-containing protein [Kocuria]|uniref:DUF4870 domain-containing protein n=1 Tax=Kocuria subflava TaxID=1736139 RepID=A0A846TYW8_9MICC|nr:MULTISPECIES: DUF4870 domain-containing protein [Kocuria]NKE10397.1 DUF4870 domain-containing protein [Kocuria subflava]